MNILLYSGILSFIVQIFTGIFDIYVLTFEHDELFYIVRELLKIELYVQVIEGIFYFWMLSNFSNIKNITPNRYYDWVITTPTMLFTYCIYLLHLQKNSKDGNTINNINNRAKNNSNKESILEIIEKNTPTLVPIFILNTLMLFFGYLVEMGRLSMNVGVSLGFVPFFMMFYIIYENYAKFTDIGIQTFYYFSSVWFLYGIAALMDYQTKNIAYNVLDLFSKNFFGIFLAYVLYQNRL